MLIWRFYLARRSTCLISIKTGAPLEEAMICWINFLDIPSSSAVVAVSLNTRAPKKITNSISSANPIETLENNLENNTKSVWKLYSSWWLISNLIFKKTRQHERHGTLPQIKVKRSIRHRIIHNWGYNTKHRLIVCHRW